MKKLLVLSVIVAVRLVAPIVSTVQAAPAACNGLLNALENIPADSPGYARVLELAQTKCGEALDHAALLALYNAANGPDWAYDPDVTTNPPGSPWDETLHHCDWYGIICNDDNRVTHVILTYNNLSGYIPDELRSLSSLGWLWLHGVSPNSFPGYDYVNYLACWETQEVLDWAENLRDPITGSGDTYVNYPLPGGGNGHLGTGVVCPASP